METKTKQTVGFIMLRHVNNTESNQYWILCYDCIRKFYPDNLIIIIDDNSDYKYISEKSFYNTIIIKSEYPKRGEVLPYYYYLKNKFFDIAFILHDSVFINKHIDFNIDNYKIIWEFEHNWDQIEDETKMIKLFNDEELLNFYQNKSLWKGCFGGMSIITHDFLTFINTKYDISLLLNVILSRFNRCSFERVIACLLQKNYKKDVLLGDIHKYTSKIKFIDINKYKHIPIIKVWTGR
jgi:hypothetical protein